MNDTGRAIRAQLQDLLDDPPQGVNAGPDDDEDMFTWTGVLTGPQGTVYEGGLFFLSIRFPETYPMDPPLVKFTTPIYHPNITEYGDICLSILFKNCSWDNGWSPAMSISTVLLSLMVLLAEPNTDHSLRPDLAKLYLDNRAEYDAAARELTKTKAMGG